VDEIDPLAVTPLFEQAAAILAARITAGRYPRRLPSERSLAAELGIALGTLRHALGDLEQRGLIIRRLGRGTFPAPPAR
jgi:DNA-binding GntR family transcriptional regulator